jgi:hypothetical protein
VRLLARLDRPPRPVDLRTRPTRIYSSIFEYIQAYLSTFKVFLKNIQRICPVHPVRARPNGQACQAKLVREPGAGSGEKESREQGL